MSDSGDLIHIGVTGHRFLADLPALQAGVNQALQRIGQFFPGREWKIVSALAEGADRLVVLRALALRPETRLVVPLPMAIPDLLQGFSSEEARAEFHRLLAASTEIIPSPDVGDDLEPGYKQAGLTLLDLSDVLVALWDGNPERGQGGTGEMVRLARQRGLPLAWVHCANNQPGSLQPGHLGDEQGQVTFERFPKG